VFRSSVFVARPPTGLRLIRAERQTFTGPAEFLRDPVHRGDVATFLADMARPYGHVVPPGLFGEPLSPALGQSYGEMGQALLGALVPADEPVDLLVLAFSVHDFWPGRATAAYLSHVCPGTPMSFAICDQGSAAAFTGLRIAREYAASAGCGRTLLIVVEQAALPYAAAAPLPSRHRGVAMLYGESAERSARLLDVRQHAGLAADGVADLAVAELAELSAGHRDVRLVLSDALAAVWSGRPVGGVRVTPPGQPSTGVWWELAGELAGGAEGADLLVAADYDPDLRYLCLAAIEPA
jgi:4-hydroxymandelate oxidase